MSRRFQFSLRVLLGVITLSAIVFAATFPRPTAWSGAMIVIATLAIPGALWAGVVSAGGYPRAFMIGAAIPSSIGLWLTTDLFPLARQYGYSDTEFSTLMWFGLEDFASMHRAHFLLVFIAMLLGGAAGVFAHWIAAGNRE